MDYLNDNIILFRIYKKMPHDLKDEFSLLITPENILNVSSSSVNREIQTFCDESIAKIRSLSVSELKENYSKGLFWSDKYIFERLIDQLKIFIQLRPQILLDYPELLI